MMGNRLTLRAAVAALLLAVTLAACSGSPGEPEIRLAMKNSSEFMSRLQARLIEENGPNGLPLDATYKVDSIPITSECVPAPSGQSGHVCQIVAKIVCDDPCDFKDFEMKLEARVYQENYRWLMEIH